MVMKKGFQIAIDPRTRAKHSTGQARWSSGLLL